MDAPVSDWSGRIRLDHRYRRYDLFPYANGPGGLGSSYLSAIISARLPGLATALKSAQ